MLGRSEEARQEFDRLNIDIDVPPGYCGVCRKKPHTALKVELENKDDGTIHKLVICRDCLSEFTPHLLAEIEAIVQG